MILVDTSVWADHFRSADADLVRLLDAGEVLAHPFVIGEIALGYLRRRALILSQLHSLPVAAIAADAEVLHLIDNRSLVATGIGYIDAHLLASVRLMPGVGLWTRDKRLDAVASNLGFSTNPDKASP